MADSPEFKLLAELILDVKKDVSDIKKEVSDIKEISSANSEVLDEHMRRSKLAEERLDLQETKFEQFDIHLKAVHTLMSAGASVLKVIGVGASLIGALVGLFKLFR